MAVFDLLILYEDSGADIKFEIREMIYCCVRSDLWYGSVPVAGVVGQLSVGGRAQDRVGTVLRCRQTQFEVVRPVVYRVTGGDGNMTGRHVSLSDPNPATFRVRREGSGPVKSQVSGEENLLVYPHLA